LILIGGKEELKLLEEEEALLPPHAVRIIKKVMKDGKIAFFI
jgi:hypothetical protein